MADTRNPYAAPQADVMPAEKYYSEELLTDATMGTRFVNFLLDSIFRQVACAAISLVAVALHAPNLAIALTVLTLFGYYVFFEAVTGRTPAKYITRTRVVDRWGGSQRSCRSSAGARPASFRSSRSRSSARPAAGTTTCPRSVSFACERNALRKTCNKSCSRSTLRSVSCANAPHSPAPPRLHPVTHPTRSGCSADRGNWATRRPTPCLRESR
jgi:RDD family